MKPITIEALKIMCEWEIKRGNGDKVIMISQDDEGNGYHYLWYTFASVDEAGAEDSVNENVATKENTIILG